MSNITYWSKETKGKKAEEYLFYKNIYDVNHWLVLLKEAQTRTIADARILFEKAMKHFPMCYRFLKLYIDKELKDGTIESVQELYKHYLPQILNIELYQGYLNFMRMNYNGEDANLNQFMIEQYEMVLEQIGYDFMSFNIWNDYIQLLKMSDALGAYAESKKLTKIRKVYSKVLSMPINGIEQLWKDYTSFEQTASKTSSDKIAIDRVRDFNNVKKLSKDMESILKGIIRSNIPTVPENSQCENLQIELWSKYLEWEKSNPIGISDTFQLTKRIIYAYEQYLQSFTFHSFVWLEATEYLERIYRKISKEGNRQEAHELATICRNIYKRGINTTMYDNLIFHFCYSDFEEYLENYDICHDIFVKLINSNNHELSLIYINYMKFAIRTKGLEEERRIFGLSRQEISIDYRVYVYAALCEFYQNQDQFASIKIFEAAIKRFPLSDQLLKLYFEHLGKINDTNLVRSSYERLIHLLEGSKKSYLIYYKYHNFEAQLGNLQNCYNIEDRIEEKYPNDKHINLKLIYQKYNYLFYSNSPKLSDKKGKKNESSKILTPDISQMRPYKPINLTYPHVNLPSFAPGGVFIPPPKLCELISLLPHPSCFSGPFIDVDLICTAIKSFNQPEINNTQMNEDENICIDDKPKMDDSTILNDLYKYRQIKGTVLKT